MSIRPDLPGRARCGLLALAAALTPACSKSAIIYGAHGAAIEGPIIGADADSITVEVDGRPQIIPRDGIRDIDHPGNGWLLFGALNTAAAVAYGTGAAVVWHNEIRSGSARGWDLLAARIDTAALIAAGIVSLLVGVPTTIWGGTTWHGARQRAEAPPPATTVHVGPGGVLVWF